MTIDESNQIEELLCEWYEWQKTYVPRLGLRGTDSTCREFNSSDRHALVEEREIAAAHRAMKRRVQLTDVCVDDFFGGKPEQQFNAISAESGSNL